MGERADLLRRVSIFGALRPETLDFFLSRATRVEARGGEALVREGEPGGDLFILESGHAEVYKERKGRGEVRRVRLAELKPGDCFGETSILAILPRCASVGALSDCVALRLRNADLLELYERDLREFAVLIMNLGRETARRLWVTNELLLDRLVG